ncbi:MAG: family 20 glycosylhydrolase [Chitinophagaceae bacterium]|nr:family 20 glycosylhydrolase [Chitinophagaceae bacterium]
MKIKFIFILSLTTTLCVAQQTVNIIPQPVSIQQQSGNFILTGNTAIQYNPQQKGLKKVAKFFNLQLKNTTGFVLPVNTSLPATIQLSIEKLATIGDEGYNMDITSKAVTIKANTTAGIVYGIQSLLQTLPAIRTNAKLEIPCMSITDYPRFKYRGMHLDVSRHFFGPELIKEYIDLIASYKMNVFHWHLVDDQGWRIEIKKYPKLTSVGAWRVDQTDKIWGSRPQAKPDEKPTYGGYYTQEQIKEIIAYAAQRNVTIIPEIELPGHVASAIASYPQLCCKQQQQFPLTGGNYTGMSSNYCAGNDSAFNFLENVLTEVIDLFPSQYIHIGGDEVDKNPWKKCNRCQARIKKEGLKNEEELQSYFIKRIEKFVNSKHKKIIGWDEILEGGLAPEATVMSWRGENGGIEAAKQSHDVIMTPGKPVYFDHYQAGPEGEPIAIGGMNTLKNVYDYEPVPKELNAEEAKHVLGAQANVWTEFITTAEHVEYMILPRMPALAEVVWSPKENRNWNSFNERLQNHFKAYGEKGLHYCPGNFTVNIRPFSQNGKLFVNLSTEILNGEVYYTTDGTEPTLTSNKYSAPVEINSTGLLKASTMQNGRIMGVQAARQSFAMHKGIGKNVIYANPVSRYYMADGSNSLTDGVRGTGTVGKFWHGFSGKDLIATIDLEEAKNIQSLALGCLQNYNDWIFLPQSVKFETSVNGTDFEEVQTVNNLISINEKNAKFDFKTSFPAKTVKFIRVTAKNNICPPGHNGEGKPGWIFADEIIVD